MPMSQRCGWRAIFVALAAALAAIATARVALRHVVLSLRRLLRDVLESADFSEGLAAH
jgi:hypothetical protein